MPLRDVTEDDLPTFFEHQSDAEAARMAAFMPRSRNAFMTHWRTRVLGHPSGRARTIVHAGEVAGHVVRWTQAGDHLVGYWVDRRLWGRGVASAALAEFLREEPLRPLQALVAVHNVGSIRVLEKCGFRRVEQCVAEDGVVEVRLRLDA